MIDTLGTRIEGEHLALPSGTTSAFAVGDTVTVADFDEVDAPTASLVGQTGPVVGIVYLEDRMEFGYFVELDIVRGIQFAPTGIVVDTTWALLENELTTVVANGNG